MCDFTNLGSEAPTAKGEPNPGRRPRDTNGRAVGLVLKYDCSCGTEREVSDICQTQACLDLQQKRLLIRAEASFKDGNVLSVNLDTHLVRAFIAGVIL